MSSVKERITKKAHSDPRVTIDSIHRELIRDMVDEEDKSEYYLNNGLLLNDYYSGNINKSNCKKGVLGYFNENNSDETTKNTIGNYMMNVDDRYIMDKDTNIVSSDKCKLCNVSIHVNSEFESCFIPFR